MNFDYIVVGAGSAGSALAARLVEKGASVLLLEAGKKERLHISRVPGALLWTVGNERFDWNYTTEPDPSRNGIVERWPRGRVPGGSSAINGMIYIRGAARDYDAWQAMGNTGWGWESVLPYFRKMETADEGTDNAFRGGMGPLRVSGLRWRHPMSQLFIDTVVGLGFPFSKDLNGSDHDGVGWNQGSTRNGLRHSAFDAYVTPKLRDANLTFMDGAHVERIILEGNRATGARFVRNGETVNASALRGIILSAGSINTPHVLMLSGIGDPAKLSAAGIEVRIENSEIGMNLMDHPALNIRLEVDVKTGNSYATPLGAMKAGLAWAFARRGVLGGPTAQALAFFKSETDAVESDLQLHLLPFGFFKVEGKLRIPNQNLMQIMVNVNYPRSRGYLELKSNNPGQRLAIHPRLLEDFHDFDVLRRGLGWVRKIASTEPFGSHVLKILQVPPLEAGPVEEEQFIRRNAITVMHPVGTCRMGTDKDAVVAPDLKVRGAERLWVADASIFPRHIAGNTNATAIMIGERAADLIHS